MNHVIVIRCRFPEMVDFGYNRRRLEMTKKYTIPSLAAQTDKDFEVLLLLDGMDPYYEERRGAYENAGLRVITHRPRGEVCQTRLDDDDLLAADYIERLKRVNPTDGWYTFNEGYVVLPDGRIYRRHDDFNQFVSRANGNVYEFNHRKVQGAKVIDSVPAWAWVKHADSTIPATKPPHSVYGDPFEGDIFSLLGISNGRTQDS